MTTTTNTTTMATLKGSEKQIAWATDIRERMIASALAEATPYINDKARSVASGRYTQEQADKLTAAWEILLEMLSLEDTAKWWIDNRYRDVRGLRDKLVSAEMIADHCAAKAAARAAAAAPVAEVVETVVVEPVAEVVEVVAEAAPVAVEVAPVPELSAPVAYSGTAKQIAWAKQIRHNMIVAAIQYRSSVPAAEISAYDTALIALSAMHHAAWWIDNRDLSARQIIAKIAAKMAA